MAKDGLYPGCSQPRLSIGQRNTWPLEHTSNITVSVIKLDEPYYSTSDRG